MAYRIPSPPRPASLCTKPPVRAPRWSRQPRFRPTFQSKPAASVWMLQERWTSGSQNSRSCWVRNRLKLIFHPPSSTKPRTLPKQRTIEKCSTFHSISTPRKAVYGSPSLQHPCRWLNPLIYRPINAGYRGARLPTTHHLRNNPLDLAQDAPDIEQIELFLSRTRYLADAFAHVQVDQVQQSVRFRQLQGAGLAQFDAANSSVTCSMNACSATWFFSSTWLLDDVFDLHILTQATDTDGLAAGPVVFVDRTPFNEVENDMEVIDFAVVDDDQRRLDDWTNSFWPYHLQDNTSMTAQGRVRLEGIAGKWIEAGQAEATVTMTAVPPKNLSEAR